MVTRVMFGAKCFDQVSTQPFSQLHSVKHIINYVIEIESEFTSYVES